MSYKNGDNPHPPKSIYRGFLQNPGGTSLNSPGLKALISGFSTRLVLKVGKGLNPCQQSIL